jgi:hypothetical protein
MSLREHTDPKGSQPETFMGWLSWIVDTHAVVRAPCPNPGNRPTTNPMPPDQAEYLAGPGVGAACPAGGAAVRVGWVPAGSNADRCVQAWGAATRWACRALFNELG